MTKKTKKYTDEFKMQIVGLHNSGKSAKAIADEYGMAKSTVNKWVGDFENSGSFKAKENRTAQENEILMLKKKLKQAEMENGNS